MSDVKEVNLTVNMGAVQGRYLAGIQNLLDVIIYIYAGHDSVTEEQYGAQRGFWAFHPAGGKRLSHADARKCSAAWLLTAFLTDSVNRTAGFLEDCRKVCALYRLTVR